MADIFGISDIAGSLIAQGTAEEAQNKALAATQAAVAQIQAVGAGPDLARQITLQQYRQAGILTPQLEQNINAHFQQIQGPSSDVTNAQKQALQQMSQVAQGGLTSQDRLALSQLQQQTARQNTAQQNAILQNMQERGLIGHGDTGAELAMRLQAQQANANQANMGGLEISSQAQQRALQAIAGLGNLSGQQAGQQFSQNQANTAIQNEQQRFNVANALAQQQRNVAAQNAANTYNLQTAQGISNANVGQANAEQQRELNAQQQMYQNKMAQAQAAANALVGQGTQIANFGLNNAKAQGQMIAGAGTLGQGLYNYASGLPSTGVQGYGPTAPGSKTGLGSEGDYSGTSSGRDSEGYFWQGGEVPGYACGGRVDMASGGMVPGPQVVPGSSPANDIIPARLSSGEYVVPKEDAPSMELIHNILKGLKAKNKK